MTNNGTSTVTITKALISWAGTGTLEQLIFGGTVIKTFLPPVTPVPIVDAFDGAESARYLDPSDTKTFQLGIPGQILATTLTLHFDEACSITTMTG